MVMFMDPIQYEERISTLVTVLLALFAFLTFARTSLPDVPISTWLDIQIFKSVLMCLLGMLETLLCKYEYVGSDLATLHLQGSYRQPAQWTLSDEQPLSTGTLASRITRMVLLGTLVLLMLQTCAQIALRMHTYEEARRGNARVVTTELKKRSTDFDESAYGWAADDSGDIISAQQSVGNSVAAAIESHVNAVERAADLDGDGDVGVRGGSRGKAINEPLSV